MLAAFFFCCSFAQSGLLIKSAIVRAPALCSTPVSGMQARLNRATRSLTVSIRHLGLKLGGRTILRDLNWRIRPGERWVLLGANGAGKTQLLKLLSGDVWPMPGPDGQRRYHWRGEWLSEPYGVKEEIAYIGAER